jgi:hypothetical protein
LGYLTLSDNNREKVRDRSFAFLVSKLISAATPAGIDKEPSILWTVSPVLAGNCPRLGEFLGIDVKKCEDRAFDKSMLECISVLYDINFEDL